MDFLIPIIDDPSGSLMSMSKETEQNLDRFFCEFEDETLSGFSGLFRLRVMHFLEQTVGDKDDYHMGPFAKDKQGWFEYLCDVCRIELPEHDRWRPELSSVPLIWNAHFKG